MVHFDLPDAALPAVRHADVDLAGKIQPSFPVFNPEGANVNFRPVFHLYGFTGKAGSVDGLRQIQRHCAKDNREQDRQMGDEAPVTAKAIFAEDAALVPLLFPAVHSPQAVYDPLALLRVQHVTDRQSEKGFLFPGSGPADGADANQRAERQIQAEQNQQQLKIPAVEHIIELQHQNRPMEAPISLCIPCNLPSLRDHRARKRKDSDQQQKQNPEAHGTEELEQLFHKHSLKQQERPPKRAGALP